MLLLAHGTAHLMPYNAATKRFSTMFIHDESYVQQEEIFKRDIDDCM